MSGNTDETIPQIALFIQESSVRPPPPPPQATSSSVPRTSARPLRPMIVPMQHLPPPPPPPPLAVPSTSTSHNTFYRAQSTRPSTSFAIRPAPTGIATFDATRPPPFIHNHAQTNNKIFKRQSDCCTAGPSKLRRTEEPRSDDAMCDACVQREISIESYRIQLEKLSAEDECQTILFKKKQNEYLKQKEILRSLVNSDLFRKIEEFLDDVPQYNFQSVFNNLNDSFRTGTSSIPNQMLLQFMEFFLSDSSKFESSQSARAQDTLRQTLSAMSRSPVRRTSPDILKTLQNILNNEDRPSSSERPVYGDTSVERAHSSGSNGVSSYHRYSNGQRTEPRVVPRVEHRAPPPPPPPAQLPPPAPRPPVPEPTPPAAVAPLAPPPAATYPHYPPQRAYYPPRYPPGPTPSTSRAPMQPYPPYPAERYPSPYYYYQ